MHPVQIADFEPGEIASPFGGTVRYLLGSLDPVASLLEWAGDRNLVPISPDDEPCVSQTGSLVTSFYCLKKHVETNGYPGLVFVDNPTTCDSSAIVFH